ncbi:hypothetical protein A3D07_00665 [Candidatus Curtissbacteria bacterium RIFCSPHIGHO2_02_FULL_42_15]|uniref:Core-binding (CB) domain-containing protein n=1 Tax=Candidatus Curtissbacteria bacterium RIFCSPHIGHO2_02_FULL_42_15 TaxID=1797716 RepID=A0A1F5GG23_9BACT|nr:MAG: hypothetical protein A3D07_00665 [Candidatus Curtissbacteria bacterium RIFCSPHIGHO2_02_FULL_42_15]
MGPEVVSAEKSEFLPLRDTLNAFYNSEKFLSLNESTRSFYQGDLRCFQRSMAGIGAESLNQITPQIVADYLASLQKSPATIARRLNSIKTLLRWAEAEHIADPSLVDQLPKTPRWEKAITPNYLSDKEAAGLVEKARGNLRNLALVTIAIQTGAKTSEILDLNVDDIHHSDHQVSIQFISKNGKSRVNYLDGESAEIIREFAENQKTGPLFLTGKYNHSGEKLTRQGFWFIVRELGKTVGRPDINPRILRNTFIRNFPGSPAELSETLGINYDLCCHLLKRRIR